LVYGSRGWIGGKLLDLLRSQGQTIHCGLARLERMTEVEAELDKFKPEFVLNSAGVTGRPNVDWCEDHQKETIRSNVIGALVLADLCSARGIQLTYFGTGCIYEYDASHPIGGTPFTEEDPANYDGSFYSKSKTYTEKLLKSYPNVLTLRLRMPISDDLHERSLIAKIIKYERVVNIPNSMSILHDLLPVSIDMTKRRLTGVYNFINPGAVSHNDILQLYKEYIKPEFTWKNLTEEEQNKILKARRSNNELDASKLLREYPDIPHIKTSIIGVFERMKRNLEQQQ